LAILLPAIIVVFNSSFQPTRFLKVVSSIKSIIIGINAVTFGHYLACQNALFQPTAIDGVTVFAPLDLPQAALAVGFAASFF